jgi:hypothetical protein
MEVSAPDKEANGQNEPTAPEKNPTSLALAILLSLISFVMVFITTVKHDFGALPVTDIVKEPVLFQSYLSSAFGGSVFIALIHVGIASFFKSKRNSSTRRRIFIGWAIAIIALEIVQLLTKH